MRPSEGLEERLVRAGVELLETEGSGHLGLREIARRAGVSHGAPRRYFPTHRQLLAAIARAGLADLTAELATGLNSGSVAGVNSGSVAGLGAPAVDRLIAAAHAYLDFARRRPEMFRLIFRHDLLAGSGYDLRDLWRPLLDQVVETVIAATDGSDLDESRDRGLLIWTHVHGLATFAADRTLEPADAADRSTDLVERAVRAQLR